MWYTKTILKRQKKIKSLFIWAEVILHVTEKTFRQVYKRHLALLWNNMKSCIGFIWDEKFSRVPRLYPIWTQLSRLARKLSDYTLQNLHHSGKLYPVNGKTFLHMNRTTLFDLSKGFLGNRDNFFPYEHDLRRLLYGGELPG